jgi:putative NADH-flavin reductase
MKIAIFGPTGKTGLHLVQKALDAGHEVTVLARSPEKLTTEDEQLKVIKGDANDPEAVEKTIAGNEAVLSVLVQEPKAIANILAGMKKYDVKRLAVAAGAGVPDPNDEPRFINHLISFLIKTFSRKIYEDAVRQNDIIRQSDVDWTIARAPMLTDKPEGKYQVTYVGKEMARTLSRAGFADFILKQAEDRQYIRKAPVISDEP